jgi:hypothetical protein
LPKIKDLRKPAVPVVWLTAGNYGDLWQSWQFWQLTTGQPPQDEAGFDQKFFEGK